LNNGFETAFDGAGPVGRINVYTGAQPASPDDAATGTLLATLTLSADAFAEPVGRSIALNAVTSDTSADASGTAGWFRFYRTDETAPGSPAAAADRRLDGAIPGDMAINDAGIVAGGTVAMSGWTYNHAP